MKLFNFKDYIRSWSVWVLGAVTVAPVLNDQTGIFTTLIPERYQPIAISILGIVGLIARAIKQTSALKTGGK